VTEAEEIANELAALVAREHRRANEAEAALEREREARERAEEEARELCALVLGDRRPERFAPSGHPPSGYGPLRVVS
jgi:hypothetical protein